MKKVRNYYFSLILGVLISVASICSYNKIFAKNTQLLNQTSAMISEKQVSIKKVAKRERRSIFSLKRRRKENKTMSNTLTTIRSFQEPMTEAEKKDMRYVLSACANMSTFSLAMAQSEIKAALFRIQEVHPLALLEEIFKDASLTQDLLRIKLRGWIWNIFYSKLVESLILVTEKNLMSKDVITTFSKNLNLEEATVISLLENKMWDDFLGELVKR